MSTDTNHEATNDIRQIVYDSVKLALADFFKKPEKKPAAPPKRRPRDVSYYIIRYLRKARQYTRETRYPPSIAKRGWMPHSKLLKLCAFPANEFSEALDALIKDGQVRVITAEELAKVDFDCNQVVYGFPKDEYVPTWRDPKYAHMFQKPNASGSDQGDPGTGKGESSDKFPPAPEQPEAP